MSTILIALFALALFTVETLSIANPIIQVTPIDTAYSFASFKDCETKLHSLEQTTNLKGASCKRKTP